MDIDIMLFLLLLIALMNVSYLPALGIENNSCNNVPIYYVFFLKKINYLYNNI